MMDKIGKRLYDRTERIMAKLKDMSVEDLEQFIEQKVLEVLGDPDSGLQLRDEFKTKLEERLKKTSRRIPHKEVLKKFA